MNRGLWLSLIALSIVLIYALYCRASSQTDFVHGFNRDNKTGEEFFKLEEEHVKQFRNVIVGLNDMEGGAPLIEPQAIDFLFPGGLSMQEGIKLSSKRNERIYVLQVMLQNAELTSDDHEFELGKGRHFEFTHQHLRLLRKLNVQWQAHLFALGIDPKRPYGDATFFELDMADILGIKHNYSDPNDLSRADRATIESLNKLHDEMVPAMQVLLWFGQVRYGWYHRINEFNAWQPVTDNALLESLKNQ